MTGRRQTWLWLLRQAILIDSVLFLIAALLLIAVGWWSLFTYGGFLTLIGAVLLIINLIALAGSGQSAAADLGSFSLTGAGDMGEHLKRVMIDKRAGYGCLIPFLLAGLFAIIIGSALQSLAL